MQFHELKTEHIWKLSLAVLVLNFQIAVSSNFNDCGKLQNHRKFCPSNFSSITIAIKLMHMYNEFSVHFGYMQGQTDHMMQEY